MRTNIIVPIDFSEASENTAFYACELALHRHWKVIISHVVITPHIPAFTPMEVKNKLLEERNAEAENKLRVLKDKLNYKFPRLIIEALVRHDYKIEIGLLNLANQHRNSVFFMASKGSKGLGRFLVPSNTVKVSKHMSNVSPVVVIPNEFHFRKPERLLLGIDLSSNFKHHKLEKLFQIFPSDEISISLCNVTNDAFNKDFMESIVKDISKHFKVKSIDYLTKPKGEKGIIGTLREVARDYDFLVLFPYSKGFWQNLFEASISEEMSHLADTPLIVLPTSY